MVPRRIRSVSRAMAPSVSQASVGPGQAVAAHGEEVVGAEERVEAGGLGRLRHPQLLLVGGALLGLDEDAEFHRLKLTGVAPVTGTG